MDIIGLTTKPRMLWEIPHPQQIQEEVSSFPIMQQANKSKLNMLKILLQPNMIHGEESQNSMILPMEIINTNMMDLDNLKRLPVLKEQKNIFIIIWDN